eukprot:scaffold239273_cov22-Tisochrysis_lutea.AAC.2
MAWHNISMAAQGRWRDLSMNRWHNYSVAKQGKRHGVTYMQQAGPQFAQFAGHRTGLMPSHSYTSPTMEAGISAWQSEHRSRHSNTHRTPGHIRTYRNIIP